MRRWTWSTLVGLVLAAGCGDSGPPRGELGLASFVWECDGGADWGCDRENFPRNIAVGSTFEASFNVAREGVVESPYFGGSVQGASPTWIDDNPDGEGLVAVAEGEVALLAVQGSTLVDFTTVNLHAVDRIALRRPAADDYDPACDGEGDELAPPECEPGPVLDESDPGDSYTIVEMPTGTGQPVEAIPLGGTRWLAGRLDYEWESLDPALLTVDDWERGRAFIEFRGPTAAELQVTALGTSFIVLVRPPGSDEVPDPTRTGGRR